MKEEKFGYKGNYGLELIIDLKGCNLSDLDQKKLHKFLSWRVEAGSIGMYERFPVLMEFSRACAEK